MKKMVTVAVATLVLCLASYGQKTHKLTSRILNDWEENYYFYNEKGLLDSMYTLQTDGGWFEFYRLYTYDEKGNCIKEDDYQFVHDSNKFKHVSYMDYTYDSENRLIERFNYNSLGTNEFNLGGKLTYEYDDKGRMVKETTYFPSFYVEGEFDLFSEQKWFYEGDLLKRREVSSLPFGETDPEKMQLDGWTLYTYNDGNQLIGTQDFTIDRWGAGDTAAGSRMACTYDDAGNVIEYATYLPGGTQAQLKYVYHYDTEKKREDVLFPYNHEDKIATHMIVTDMSPNVVVREEWWQVPMEVDTLVHGGDYVWTYEALNVGTESRPVVDNSDIRFFVCDGTLYFLGLRPGSSVQVFDMTGAVVKSTVYKGGIPVSDLPKGIYLARVNGRQVIKFLR